MKSSHREFVLHIVRTMLTAELGARPSCILLRPVSEGVYRIEAELQDGRKFHGRCDWLPPHGYAVDMCLAPEPCSCFA